MRCRRWGRPAQAPAVIELPRECRAFRVRDPLTQLTAASSDKARLCGLGAGLLGLAVDRALELRAGRELGNFGGGDRDRLACTQVTALTLAALLNLETTKAG